MAEQRLVRHPGDRRPLTTTVTDAALMLNALAGPDRRDPQSIDREPPDFVAACRGSVRGLRVAWSPDLGHATVAPDVAEATRRAALVFERLGASVEEVPIGWGTLAREIIEPTWGIHFVARFAEKAEERPDWIEPSLLAFVQDGHARSALEYRRLLARRAELYDRVRQLFDTYDLLLTPTMPITAWRPRGSRKFRCSSGCPSPTRSTSPGIRRPASPAAWTPAGCPWACRSSPTGIVTTG
ncbi:amidase family protein [Actinomadura madurae]|nr:amidase family protein [Actinomadura madurae]MCP9953553.1 amidase family protein [Actinomadura madurae]MCP9982786.1 amidase family protein [Actinomadura madurae]MCQ0019022.1 amidase family protein [Actinomadura madurae]